MFLKDSPKGRSLLFIALLTFLTACSYRQDHVEGVVRVSTDQLDYEVRTTTEDDNCWNLADDEVVVVMINCEDWLVLETPVPVRLEEKNQMEVGKTYELPTIAYATGVAGTEIQELLEGCELSREPRGTITRVDDSQWKQATAGWSGVFDLEFEHGCISGTLRHYRNIKLD